MNFAPRSTVLSKLNNPNSTVHGVLTTALYSGLTLVDPRKLGLGGRIVYRSLLGALAGWSTYVSLGDEAELIHPQGRVGFSVGASAAVLALAELGEKLDATIHDAIGSRGIKNPRLPMAAGTAVWAAGSWLLGRQEPTGASFGWFAHAPNGAEDENLGRETVEIPQDVRALAIHLLSATEDFGAPTLLAQLEVARAIEYEGDEEGAFYPGIGFYVPDDVEIAVPFNATFGVMGRYKAIGDKNFDVYLTVVDGKLDALSIGEGSDWTEEDFQEWEQGGVSSSDLTHWPAPEELKLLGETPQGRKPLA